MILFRDGQYWNIGKPNNLKVFGKNKPKGLNIISKICYGCVCLMGEKLSFDKVTLFRDCKFKKKELCLHLNMCLTIIQDSPSCSLCVYPVLLIKHEINHLSCNHIAASVDMLRFIVVYSNWNRPTHSISKTIDRAGCFTV